MVPIQQPELLCSTQPGVACPSNSRCRWHRSYADRRTLNVVVGRSLFVQLVENPNLVTRLAQFLAKNQKPVALVWVTRRDKQNGIGESLRALEVPNCDPRARQRLLRFPRFTGTLTQICRFLDLPRTVLFFEAILDIRRKRFHFTQ